MLLEIGKKHAVKFIKAMQCRSGNWPQDQALWEGVPLREVLKLVGKMNNIRRVYWHGFHNNDPKQMFQSSLGYNQIMETPPWTRITSIFSRAPCGGRLVFSGRDGAEILVMLKRYSG